MDYIFIPLIVFFAGQKPSGLMKSHLFLFGFIAFVFGVVFKMTVLKLSFCTFF